MVHWGEYYVICLLKHILMITQVGTPCKWTNDSQRFLLEHLDTICDSPSHIYHSALPLSPPSTWLQECYSSELLHEVRVVKGLPDRWGVCSRTVPLGTMVYGISCHNNTIAIGSAQKDIIILNAVTGSQTAILSGHTDEINSVVFSSDGRSLVSGSDDTTVKLWDLQTGGAIKTFSGHSGLVSSASISVDNATIASGSFDETIRLWGTQTGECYCVIKQPSQVRLVKFSPTNPQHFLSKSDNEVKQWNVSGHEVGPAFNGYHADFSPDGTQLISHYKQVASIQNSSSGVVTAKFPVTVHFAGRSCYSLDGRLVAISAGGTIYAWNITNPEPHLVGTFIGHTDVINSLAFSSPSSLISASSDQSVKFWKISPQSTDLVGVDPMSVSLGSATVMSITLRAKDDLSITSDSNGVVKTWDIFTGICKASFQTPAKRANKRDVQIINGKLILAWHASPKIKIWDVEKDQLLCTTDGPGSLEDIKISEDGSRVYSIGARAIQAQSIQTGEIVGNAGIKYMKYNIASLTVNGSRVWVQYRNAETQVWDFGTPDSSPIQLPNTTLEITHSSGTILWDNSLFGIKEKATGKVVFRLSKGYGKPVDVQWTGQYLVAAFISGEVLVLDFSYMLP